MIKINPFLYFLGTFLVLTLLWPLIKWLIIIVLVLLLLLFLYIKTHGKVTIIKNNEIHENEYQHIDDEDIKDDVIDVEFTAKEVKEDEK